MPMVGGIVSAVLQVGVVLVLAGALYLLVGRRKAPFLRFIGLYRAPARAVAAGLVIGVAVTIAILVIPGIGAMASGRGTVAGDAVRDGSSAAVLTSLLIAAIFKTSLSEELLFRGLIGKRLIDWIGFNKGNLVQAILFGLVHLLLTLVPTATAALVAAMVIITGAMGWINGWLNERLGNGSILPGWAAHAIANTCAYLWLAAAM